MTSLSKGGEASTHPDPAATADDLIRSVMTEQKREFNRNALPELEPIEPGAVSPAAQTVAHAASKKAARPKRQFKSALMKRITGYRPTRKHILWTTLALVVFFRPWLIPGLLFVTFWVALIAYLTLGHDRIYDFLVNSWNRLVVTKPKWADALRRTADRFALMYDAFLKKLPEHWAERLALPDPSQAAETQNKLDELPDPFERLKMPDVYRG